MHDLMRVGAAAILAIGIGAAAGAAEPTYVDQGSGWTPELRALFYKVDQGSRLIPRAWLDALKQANGKSFLEGSMARYGYLPNTDPMHVDGLPVGFNTKSSPQGDIVGITCAACHTRQISVAGREYRIDGAPAIIDFETFVDDLDKATQKVISSDGSFEVFADTVLGPHAKDPIAFEMLRAEFELWTVRYHAFIEKSLPKTRHWGPARLDAISLIYNRMAGLDVGAPPTYLLPQNIEVGDAPARYPFLWNSSRQDLSQWTGFAANGNDFYALTRNLGELYGVFGTFHPQPTAGSVSVFEKNYVVENSANFDGLAAAENMSRKMGPPVWPWAVDRDLAARGKAIFERSEAAGGCVSCHGIAKGIPRPPEVDTLKTRVKDVGTDQRQWQVVLREVDTGSMAGAAVPGSYSALKPRDSAIGLLRAAVIGAIVEKKKGEEQSRMLAMQKADPATRVKTLVKDDIELSFDKIQGALKLTFEPSRGPPPLKDHAYEARVLQGIWSAAPYLHNGSVPTLEDMLKPAAERPASFQVGPAYDPDHVGLARTQTVFNFTLTTTDCSDVTSGDSRCGHEYGTKLPAADKKALLEYLKTL